MNTYLRSLKSHYKLLTATIATVSNWETCILFHIGLLRSNLLEVRLRNGLKLMVRKKSGDMISILEDFYENQYQIGRNSNIRNGDVLIDIGSHIGTFTLSVKHSFPRTKIYAFEPDLASFELSKKNIRLNNVRTTYIHNLGIWKSRKKMALHLNKGDFLGSSLVTDWGDKDEQVECITLKDIFQIHKINRCSMLKMDIEGAEYDVLYSTPDNIFNKIDSLYVEYHEVSDSSKSKNREKLMAFLRSKGYRTKKHANLPIIFATTKNN